MNSSDVVKSSAALRGQHKFAEAISLVENNMPSSSDELRIAVLLEGFYAAKEGGVTDKAKHFAALVRAIDPNVPSIEGF